MKGFFSHLKGDAFGGLTAGIVALPLALAFGASSGLGPAAGLYGAIFISFFAALFGGTSTQISGPTAPMTAVSMVVIAQIIAVNNGSVEKALPAILIVFLLSGLIQILLGMIKLGKYIKYIPYPVVSGFMTAIGVIILLTQILPTLGYYPKEDQAFVSQFEPQAKEVLIQNILEDEVGTDVLVIEDLVETVRSSRVITPEEINKEAKNIAGKKASGAMGAIKMLPRVVQNINWLELLLALGTILIIYGFKKITTAIPSTLVALVVMSGIAYGFGLSYRPIEEIPSGLPIPQLEMFTHFDISTITPYIFTAITLALLGAIDSLLTSIVADNMTKTRHQPNKELIGQGIGNTIAAVFGGIPGAGATIRTVVNINAGGKTRLSGMIAGLVLLVVMLGLAEVASKIPAAVLAGILITVGIGVMDYKGLKAIPSLPKDIKIGPIKLSSEVMIMIVVLMLSTFWNLVYAVGIGLVLASLLFMKKIGDLTASKSMVTSLKEDWNDEKDFPVSLKEEVTIKHIHGSLFFGSTTDFQNLAAQIPETSTVVIIRIDRMPYMDQSGLYAMEEVILGLQQKEIKVVLVGLLKQPRYMMERIDIIPDLVPEDLIFENFETCLAYISENVANTV